MENLQTSVVSPQPSESAATNEQEQAFQPPRKELFAVISLLFFAPLIRKQIKEENFGFSDADKTYILVYTKKGNIILGTVCIAMLLLASSYIWKITLIHTLSSCFFIAAAALICVGMAHIFMTTTKQKTDSPATQENDEPQTYSVATLISAYLPLLTTRKRYSAPQHTQLVNKEGRVLRSIRGRLGILFPTPFVLLGGLVALFLRVGMNIVSGYQYLPFLDKVLSKQTAEPEERGSYPISLLTGFHKKQSDLQIKYSELQALNIRQYVFITIWIAILVGVARLQLQTHTDNRWFSLALFPYILIFCRYLLIYLLVHKLPYIPGVQDIFSFTAHSSSNDASPTPPSPIV